MKVIEEFEKMIQWKSVGNKKVPEPVPGQDEEFDAANAKVEKIKNRLDEYIEGVRKKLKARNINYTMNSKRFRYEIEVPEDMAKKIGDQYINTSNVKGKKRYQTDELREMINDLEDAEDKFKDALIPFLRTMFSKFYESKEIFTRAV
jgi:DNA mismatch repair protein MSH6